MALVDRAQRITLSPATEWPVIAPEPATVGGLYTSYIIPLALIAPVCAFLSQALFLHHLILGAALAAMSFVLGLIGIFLISLIADALAPSFNGVKNGTQSLKWIAYANTPAWLAGIANLIPFVGPLIVLIAAIYGLYVLYLGASPMMRVPPDKSIGYVVVVVICTIVLYVVIGAIGAAITIPLMAGAIATGAMNNS